MTEPRDAAPAPADPTVSDPAVSDPAVADEVVDGEVDEETGEVAGADASAGSDADAVDAELVTEHPSAVTEDVPAGASPDPVAVPDAAPGPAAGSGDTLAAGSTDAVAAGSDDTLAAAGVVPAEQPVNTPPTVIPAAPGSAAPTTDYTDQGVPTLDYVRDKIEGRWGTAIGSTELAEASQAGKQQQDAADERDRLAQEKLAELRRQVDGDQ